jgi:hypothetical protein
MLKNNLHDKEKNINEYYKILKMSKCPICDEKIKDEEKLECSHKFCGDCIKKWFEYKKNCPICRKESNKFPNIKPTRVTFDDNITIDLSDYEYEIITEYYERIVTEYSTTNRYLKVFVILLVVLFLVLFKVLDTNLLDYSFENLPFLLICLFNFIHII